MDNIKYNTEAKEALKRGIDILVDTVKITLGPMGKNVIISEQGEPHVTKDGVTVVKSIHLEDPYESLGAELIKQAASKTVEEVGDSTTQTCLLAREFISRGMELYNEINNPFEVKKGMYHILDKVTEYLKKQSIPITTDNQYRLLDIATISANNDSIIGNNIAEIYNKIGLGGIIKTSTTDIPTVTYEVNKGMTINKGYAAPSFINTFDKYTTEFDNPYILIANKKLYNIRDIYPYLDIAKKENRPIVIIAEGYDTTLLSDLSANNAKNIIRICPIIAPGFGNRRTDLLNDVGIFITPNPEFENDFIIGEASQIIITATTTTILEGQGDPNLIKEKVELLKNTISNCKNNYEIKDLKNRITNLTSGIATLFIGAPTEVERKELIDRYDDAICATKTAIEGGISIGGGNTYMLAKDYVTENQIDTNLSHDFFIGCDIVYNSLDVILNQNLENAYTTLLSTNSDNNFKHTKSDIGINIITGTWENLRNKGIVDPTNSLIAALKNAVSVASMFLTSEVTIINN